APKEAPRAQGAGGGDDGVAAAASRATAASRAKTADLRRQHLSRLKSPPPMKAEPTTMNRKNNQVPPVPINRKAASGGPGVADVEADAAGAAARRVGLPDQLPMNSDRSPRWRRRARLPISTDIPRKLHSRPCIPKRTLRCRSRQPSTGL